MLRSFGEDNFALMDYLQQRLHVLVGYEKRILYCVQIYFTYTMLTQHKIRHGIFSVCTYVHGHSKDAGKESID